MSASTLELPAEFSIADVGQWKAAATEKLNTAELVLDGSAVSRIDTAGIQLLVSLFLQCHRNETDVKWRSASDAIVRTAVALGVSEQLQLDQLGNTTE